MFLNFSIFFFTIFVFFVFFVITHKYKTKNIPFYVFFYLNRLKQIFYLIDFALCMVSRVKYITTKYIFERCLKLGRFCSIGTIRSYLKSINYYHKKENKTPLISKKNQSKRMAFSISNYFLIQFIFRSLMHIFKSTHRVDFLCGNIQY